MYRPKRACILCKQGTDCYFTDIKVWCCWGCKQEIVKIINKKKIKNSYV